MSIHRKIDVDFPSNQRVSGTVNIGNPFDIKNVEYSNRMIYPISDLELLDIPTYEGSGQAVHPSVIYLPRGFAGYKWWMAFTPYPNGDVDTENPSVVASNDGVNWEVPSKITNPIEPSPANTGTYNRDAEIIWVPEDRQLRVYWGNSLGEGYYRTIDSNKNVGERVPVTGVFSHNQATVVKVDGKYMAWSTTNVGKSAFSPFNFPYYFSDDGVTFTQGYGESRTNLYGSIWHQGITYDAAGFHSVASYFHRGDPDRLGMELFYGYSTDGINWTYESTPIVARNNDWTSDFVYKSHICPMGEGIYRIFVSGRKTDGTYAMGYLDVKTNNQAYTHALTWNNLPPRTVTLFNKIQLREGQKKWYFGNNGRVTIPEFGMYKNKMLQVYNSHDQEISLRFFSTASQPNTFRTINFDGNAYNFPVPSNTTQDQTFTESSIPILGGMFSSSVTMAVEALGTTPLTGEITVLMYCWN